jgi:hypothetical protein
MGSRRIGALAGLAPATVMIGYYVVTGGPITPGLGAIAAVAVAAGWLVGPTTGGSPREAPVAMVAYFMIGYLLFVALVAVLAIWGDVPGGPMRDPGTAIGTLAGRILLGLVYLPVWAFSFAPVALVWVVAVWAIRGRVRPAWGEDD